MCGKSTNFHAKQKAALMSRFSVYTNVPGKRLPRRFTPRNDSKPIVIASAARRSLSLDYRALF
jgi:hypothetical protein